MAWCIAILIILFSPDLSSAVDYSEKTSGRKDYDIALEWRAWQEPSRIAVIGTVSSGLALYILGVELRARVIDAAHAEVAKAVFAFPPPSDPAYFSMPYGMALPAYGRKAERIDLLFLYEIPFSEDTSIISFRTISIKFP
ncbi:hypothetical protein [Geobacter sp. DSM 9736]|uniref:hypothetical protein n=1 Tax=Geobacter sp. DSM 9736 TaxID=1277350 RepID=UPI000B509104|nr:hypothetical protein [Geobacter sp. DSM 9736]SNB47602.1 hypothetical protein SAMN06269301_3093 [Geobacter sp. DSM 9736]